LLTHSIATILYDFPFPKFSEKQEKADAVKEAAFHILNNDKKHCFGEDIIFPKTCKCK
jgi:hypothetical protein